MKSFVLFDHDGVLVDTEQWYYLAGKHALAEVGLDLDKEQYLRDMTAGAGTWTQAINAGVDDITLARLKERRNERYRQYLCTESIEIAGVQDALAAMAGHVRMAIVTTSKRADFELIHRSRHLTKFMDFVLVREDYEHSKPDPEPYLTGLRRFGATAGETLVVEDSARGLASAVAAGIECAVVRNGFTARQDFSTARFRIDNLAQLTHIVLGTG
ncbi:HAD family hydrolase [Leekyejoonella antrihumi]|uniref:HAD family phosphatase n=1 Tax=Leekyejoonella antrihumi TaxID=1660198 RepID=A0A563DPC8_9MICO|nr:HAD family phosphatase [Leekyejoonella antrihumi]TWP32067.1 HAD family phosphatase [Leekyejoonella antrihumi]